MSKKAGTGLSVSELLGALTQAQQEREAAMEELRRVSEAERRKAEAGQLEVTALSAELQAARDLCRDLTSKCNDLEETLSSERENNAKIKMKEEEELATKLEKWKGRMEYLTHLNKELEQTNNELTEELTTTRNKLKKVSESEENLKDEVNQLKEKLNETKTTLEKANKNQEMADSELHLTKMQLLKENNINNRLLDELKRTRKDIDEYKEEINKLKNTKYSYENTISQQIKDLSILITENNKENSIDDLREIRMNLSTILKENFLLNSRIHEVYTFLTKGDAEMIHASTQTSIGLDKMYDLENMDREMSNLIMHLREELVTNKNDMIELKQQNQQLRLILTEMKKEKHKLDAIDEEENRVTKLENSVRSLKKMLQENEKPESDKDIFSVINQLKRDVDNLKKTNRGANQF